MRGFWCPFGWVCSFHSGEALKNDNVYDEIKVGASTSLKLLNMDWRIYLVPLSTFPADVGLEGARPSSIGSASELTILTCRISEHQCCLEIDSVSRFTGFRRGKIENLFSVMMNFFFFDFFLVLC